MSAESLPCEQLADDSELPISESRGSWRCHVAVCLVNCWFDQVSCGGSGESALWGTGRVDVRSVSGCALMAGSLLGFSGVLLG